MPRDYKVFLQDILDAIGWIEQFVTGVTFDQFKADRKTFDAVVRNLEIIGEAVKGIPLDVRQEHPQVPWQRIAGLRDILIHQYFGIGIDIVWDVVQTKLAELKQETMAILAKHLA